MIAGFLELASIIAHAILHCNILRTRCDESPASMRTPVQQLDLETSHAHQLTFSNQSARPFSRKRDPGALFSSAWLHERRIDAAISARVEGLRWMRADRISSNARRYHGNLTMSLGTSGPMAAQQRRTLDGSWNMTWMRRC